MTMPASTTEEPTRGNLVFAWLIAVMAVAGLAVFPGSGYALQTLSDWHDQQIFLSAASRPSSRACRTPITGSWSAPPMWD